jgi:hypothetical protein
MKDLESYLETHYEIVQELTRVLDREEDEKPLKPPQLLDYPRLFST